MLALLLFIVRTVVGIVPQLEKKAKGDPGGVSVLPVDAKQGAVTARNVPGLIQIGPAITRDVGTIEIVTTDK